MRKVMTAVGALLVLSSLALSTLFAGETKSMVSGFQVGERTPPFDVVDVTGPNKGQELCYVCNYSGAPTVMAWINTDPAQATNLVSHMQKLVNQNQGLKAFAVVVAGPEIKPAIEAMAAKRQISIPVVFLPKGKQDQAIGRYKINTAAKTTVLVSKGNKVLANFVNVRPDQLAQIDIAAKRMLAKGI
jgi:hypothetical protein